MNALIEGLKALRLHGMARLCSGSSGQPHATEPDYGTQAVD